MWWNCWTRRIKTIGEQAVKRCPDLQLTEVATLRVLMV